MTVSEAVLTAILDGIGECFYAVDRDWRITVFNAGAERHFGCSRTEAVGRFLWEVVPASYDSDLARRFRAVMDSREPALLEADSIVLSDRVIEGRLFPLGDGMAVAFEDVTERRRAERALKRREAELARVQRIAGVGGLEVDLRDGFVNRRSPEYLRLHGLSDESVDEPHEAWVNRVHPDDRERVELAFKEAVAGDAIQYVAEYRIRRPNDGEERWIEAWAEIERDGSGRALRLVGAHRDVTERKRAETHQRLLIHELNHRVKNTLATVQSIAQQSVRGAAGGDAAWPAFEGRLLALSRAHDLLTRENWDGAELGAVVAEAAGPYARDDRIRMDGEPVRLRPRAALALAMAVQELATNASKYGSLSTDSGYVAIRWSLEATCDGSRLRLTWREHDGPPVLPPERRGFGSRLIERSLSQDLGGEARLVFDPGGVICEIDAVLSSRPEAIGMMSAS